MGYLIKINNVKNTIKVINAGRRGETGVGVIGGGTAGQYLVKSSAINYDTEWKTLTLADAQDDTTHRTVTDTDKSIWNAKQNALIFDNTPTEGSTNPATSGGIKTQLNTKQNSLGFTPENSANKGVAGGYASLDTGGKVPVIQLPSAIMEYKGTWNPQTNIPTLVNGTGDTGDIYRASVTGTANFGSGNIKFFAGDLAMYNGTIWERSPSADGVSSVNTYTGDVTITKSDLGLGNVDNTSDIDKPVSTAQQAEIDGVRSSLGSGGYAGQTYLEDTNSDITGYKTLTHVPIITGVEKTLTITNTEQLWETYLFPLGLDVAVIDAGQWGFTFYNKVSSIAGVSTLRAVIFIRDTAGNEFNLFSITSPDINNTTYASMFIQSAQPSFEVNTTDRLGVKLYASTDKTNITFYNMIGGINGCYITMPLALRHSQLRDKNNESNYQHVTTAQITQWNSTDADTVDGCHIWRGTESEYSDLTEIPDDTLFIVTP